MGNGLAAHYSTVRKRITMLLRKISVLLVLFLSGCVGIPKNVTPR